MIERVQLETLSLIQVLSNILELVLKLLSDIIKDTKIGAILIKPTGEIVQIVSRGANDFEINSLIQKIEPLYHIKEDPFIVDNFLVFPLKGKFSTYGFLFLEKKSGSEAEEHLREASETISKITEMFNLVDLYMIDPVTGLPGKKYLLDRLDEQIQRKIRYKEDFSLIIVKIDNFEDLGENLPQENFEALLNKLSNFFSKIKRKSDIIARFDPDKLAILMPHTDPQGAESFIERLKASLRLENFQQELKFSFGLANSKAFKTLEHDDIILNALLNLQNKKQPYKQEEIEIEIVGHSQKIAKVKEEIIISAQTDITMLILGETGTGKELVARKIHELSPRRDKPFMIIDCASIPETLLESELFGHEKGAFTGATSRKIGLFEIANGGTVFLDEIEATSPAMQAKILRTIEEKTIRRVGGTELIPIDVRILCAANVDLEEEVKKGNFRKDLYYRISGMIIQMPPLRERKEDIPELVNYFVKKYAIKEGKLIKGVTPGVYELLKAYDWPGNVRELEKEVERMIAFTEDGGYITEDKVSSKIKNSEFQTFTLDELLGHYEKNILIDALLTTNWNETKAAKMLGISRTNLIAKMKKYGINKNGNLYLQN